MTAGTRREAEWITRDMGRIFPLEWERFIELVPLCRARGRVGCGLRPSLGRPRPTGSRHSWSHNCFLADGEVLAGMPRLAGIPGVLIHGRYDVSGPLDTAWAVHSAWAGSKLVVLGDTGHGGASLWGQLTASLDSFRTLQLFP